MNGDKQQIISEAQRPFVSSAGVKSVLDSLIYRDPTRCYDAMLTLVCVDEFLLENEIPDSETQRYYALTVLIVELIQSSYETLKHALGGDTIQCISTITDVIRLLSEDAQEGNSVLLSWAVLHAQYVYAEFELTKQAIAKAIGATERTLRRYQQQGVRLLTDELIRVEWKAFKTHRLRRLRANLPSYSGEIIGRGHEQRILRNCFESVGCNHVLITGTKGIGKTNLAQALLQMLTLDAQVDHVCWFNKPIDLESVIMRIKDQLTQRFAHITIQEFTLSQRTALILDDAEHIIDQLPEYIKEFGHCFIIIISRQCNNERLLRQVDSHIHLQPLSYDNTVAIYNRLYQHDSLPSPVTDATLQSGNPGLVRAQARGFEASFDLKELPFDTRALLYSLVLTPNRSLPHGNINPYTSKLLVDYSLAVADSEQITLSSDSVEIVENYLEHPDQQSELSQYVEYLMSEQTISGVEEKLTVVENLLLQHGKFMANVVLPLALQFWRMGIDHGRINIWLQILTVLSKHTDTPAFLMPIGVLLSRLGKHGEAADMFTAAIHHYGKMGEFVKQAEVMYELSVGLRRQGQYAAALRVLEALLIRKLPNWFEVDIRLATAKIYIDIGKYDQAATVLEKIRRDKNLQISLIYIEIDIGLGNPMRGINQLNAIQDHLSSNVKWHVNALLARGYAAVGDYDRAANHFQYAVHCTQNHDDLYVTARIGSNFGAVLLKSRAYERSIEILEWAEVQQKLNSDIAGLAATQHNLKIAKQLRLSTS